ncbi:MAG: hypothetical protein JWO83_1501 [Caulobacteraceae bacterium]|nr:hypothetical protein [Caulobacteraceae bacterium]
MRPALASSPLARKAAVVLALVVAAVAFDRLTRLPAAGPLDKESRIPPAASGQAMTLGGVSADSLLGFRSGAGEGVLITAKGSPLVVDGRATPSLTWQVSRPADDGTGSAEAPNDNKVFVQLTRVAGADRPTLVLAWAGENTVQPALSIKVTHAPVRVEGHVGVGDLRRLPPTALTLGSTVVPGPAVGASFVLPDGGVLRVAFAGLPNNTARGLVIDVGDSGDNAGRLSVRSVSVADLTGDGGQDRPVFVACAAPAGGVVWRTLWSGGRPTGRDCKDNAMWMTDLKITQGQIAAQLTGSAYVASDQPAVSRWWTWVQGNLVASGLFVALVGGLLAWAQREFRTPKGSAPAAAAAPPPAPP